MCYLPSPAGEEGSHFCGSFENVLAPGDQRRFLMRSTPAKPFSQPGPSSGRDAAGAPREHAAGAGTATQPCLLQPQGWKHWAWERCVRPGWLLQDVLLPVLGTLARPYCVD